MDVALLGPLTALTLCALVPFGTAALLRILLLRNVPDEPEERARRVWPFRQAAMIVGAVQLQLAWLLGSRALGPTLDHPGGWRSLAFGFVTLATTFLAGGIARRFEEPAQGRSTVMGTVQLRLRMLAWLLGPLGAQAIAATLPFVSNGPNPEVRFGWIVVAILVCAFGAAYGSLLVALVTRAIVPAPDAWREMAREVAAREGVRLAFALRFPTPGSNFANAAALPWARSMIVTDRIASLLEPDELRAVLAHEAGHLSEGPYVAAARLGAATVALAALALVPGLNDAIWHAGPWVTVGLLAMALSMVVLVRPLARRMEERADAHARETTGAAPLAAALRKLHALLQQPSATGARRVHPDLHDRLTALGIDAGPRPAPPKGRAGLRAALGVLAVLLALVAVPMHFAGEIPGAGVAQATSTRAAVALAIDPWSGNAWLVRAYAALRSGDPTRAQALGRIAARTGPDPAAYWTFWAEWYASQGLCDAARERFARAQREGAGLSGRAPRPPSLEQRCGVVGPES